MVTDQYDQRVASAPRGQDGRAASAGSMRPDLVLDRASRISATTYLRCGGCGATLTLVQSARHDGPVDYVLDRHDSCGASAARTDSRSFG